MTRRRISITLAEGVDDWMAVSSVAEIIRTGRISGNKTKYCYVTTLSNGLTVAADLTRKKNDTFKVWRTRE